MNVNDAAARPRPDTAGRAPDDLIREGETCLDSGDASRARDLFEAALQLRPDDPRAMIGLGHALTARRRYVEAEALYQDMENRHIAAIEARAGAAEEEPLDGSRRTLLIGSGLIHWDVGPRFSLQGTTARRPLLDSAALVDWGIRLDTAGLRMEYQPDPAWTITGWGDIGWYSDGNVRVAVAAGAAYKATITHPVITAGIEARIRRFRDDRDFGYLDPIRYDSEIFTLRLSDEIRERGFYWSVTGVFGRQAYDPNDSERAPVADQEPTVRGGAGTLGASIGDRVRLEASYLRTNDALETAPGFPVQRTTLLLRVRL